MTEVTKEVKVVDPRIAETAAKQKVVAAAIKKLVTINERAAAAVVYLCAAELFAARHRGVQPGRRHRQQRNEGRHDERT